MTRDFVMGDMVFIGKRVAIFLNMEGDEARIIDGNSIYAVNPSQIHHPTTKVEKLVILFLTACMQNLNCEELFFQVENTLQCFENEEVKE